MTILIRGLWKKPVKKPLKELYESLAKRDTYINALRSLVVLSLLVLSIFTILGLFGLLIPKWSVQSLYSSNWTMRFVSVAFLLHISAIVLVVFLQTRVGAAIATANTVDFGDKLDQYTSSVSRYGLISGVLLLFYIAAIYPYVPQQIGGGRILPVSRIDSSNTTLQSSLLITNTTVYLLDRSSDNTLLLIAHQPQGQEVVEVPNSDIKLITFRDIK